MILFFFFFFLHQKFDAANELKFTIFLNVERSIFEFLGKSNLKIFRA